MEVSKDLRHHTTLVTAVIAITLAVSVSIAGHNTKSLVSRPFNIQPTKNGLTKISAHQSLVNNGWTQAGRETELDLSLH